MAKPKISLHPFPRRLECLDGHFSIAQLPAGQIPVSSPGMVGEVGRFILTRLETAVGYRAGAGCHFAIEADMGLPAQGYCLEILPDRVNLRGQDPAGLFYAGMTLLQLAAWYGERIPCMRIEDWPDYRVRGIMLDVSRDKLPTLATLFALIDRFAQWKINQVQFYTEHTFAYAKHSVVWRDASPLTGDEIRQLDVYCRERFIELVPNQNSFGHMTRWLMHGPYRHLAELEGRFQTPWGVEDGPFSLCPVDPRSLEFIDGLYAELLPNFSSGLINSGCDETFDVGQGRSQAAVAERGAGRVYFDYLMGVRAAAGRHGRRMQFWADILLSHPQFLDELPDDVIPLIWGYEADHPFAEQTALVRNRGLEYYVCPGTSSWNSLAGRPANALQNLCNAAETGLRHGAAGYLITDWGDHGHWQQLPVSYLGWIMGAGLAWGFEANRHLDADAVLSWAGFGDPDGKTGPWLNALGNVYLECGQQLGNSTLLFWLLQKREDEIAGMGKLETERLRACLEQIDHLRGELAELRFAGDDADWLRDEFEISIWMIGHACQRGLFMLEGDPAVRRILAGLLLKDLEAFIPRYRQAWLRRNRPGGLEDSAGRFNRILQEYKEMSE